MFIKIVDNSFSEKKELIFVDGINFIITPNINFQRDFYLYLLKSKNKYINNILVSKKQLKKKLYMVVNKEKGFFYKQKKYKNIIDTESEIIRVLGIQEKVFDLKLKQLWHWEYLCSCAVGISKGKKILLFPWISAKECSIQSYRLNKLYEYSKQNDLIVIVPTNDITEFQRNSYHGSKYNITSSI